MRRGVAHSPNPCAPGTGAREAPEAFHSRQGKIPSTNPKTVIFNQRIILTFMMQVNWWICISWFCFLCRYNFIRHCFFTWTQTILNWSRNTENNYFHQPSNSQHLPLLSVFTMSEIKRHLPGTGTRCTLIPGIFHFCQFLPCLEWNGTLPAPATGVHGFEEWAAPRLIPN